MFFLQYIIMFFGWIYLHFILYSFHMKLHCIVQYREVTWHDEISSPCQKEGATHIKKFLWKTRYYKHNDFWKRTKEAVGIHHEHDWMTIQISFTIWNAPITMKMLMKKVSKSRKIGKFKQTENLEMCTKSLKATICENYILPGLKPCTKKIFVISTNRP